MSATMRVIHSTGYRYDGGATSSFNEARMTPRTTADQSVLSARLEVSPTAWTHPFVDYWGTPVTAFEVHERHEELRVVSTSTVDVHRPAQPAPDPAITWESLSGTRIRSDFAEYLECGRLVAPDEELAGMARQQVEASRTPYDAVRDLAELVGERVRYLPGVTSVTTTAAEAWQAGAGVCQDLSHLLIGALRTAGIPARYVSGYVWSDAEAPIGTPVRGESHAWTEFWAGQWIGLDPTNRSTIGEDHIIVGHGRDYADVPPLRGIFTGGTAGEMYVEVLVTRLR